MRLNKKGFTMVEILTVLVILSVIMAIAIPIFLSLKDDTKDQYYKTLEDNVKAAGIDYYTDYRSERPLANYATNQVNLNTLTDKKYIEDVVDAKGNDTCTGYVRIFKEKEGEYDYKSCLVCEDGNYKTKDVICGNDYDPSNNNKIYTIQSPDTVYSYINKKIDETKLEKATIKARGEVVGKATALASSFQNVDVSKVGTYDDKVEYVYEIDGVTLTAKSDLEIFQNSAPKVEMSECTSETNCDNGSYTSNEWTKYNIQEVISSDEYKEGKLDRYQIYDEITSTWKDLCTSDTCSDYTSTPDGTVKTISKQVRSLDEEGNPSAILTYQINIDKILPSCTLKVTSGTLGENNWYKTDIGVGFDTKKDNVSVSSAGITNSTTANYDSEAYTFTKEGTGTIYGYVKDSAGNTNKCNISLKKDSVAPTIATFKAAKTETYNNLKVKLTISATDETSKGMQIYLSNSGYQKSGSWATYATSKNWTLSGSLDGTKRTIYLSVKDEAGNVSNKTTTYTPYKECTTTTTTWSGTWGKCSVTCGTGTQEQTGTKYDSYTNKSCGTTSKSQPCTMPSCAHTHEYGGHFDIISGTYKNYLKTTYHFTGTWTCSVGHTHYASPSLIAYEQQCIHCGKTYREINNREWSNQRLWCPCDVPGLGCQLAS